MQRYFPFLVFSSIYLLALILSDAHAESSPTPEPTDCSMGLKLLARDLSQLMEKQLQALGGDRDTRLHQPISSPQSTVQYSQFALDRIANKPKPGNPDFASIGSVLSSLAIEAHDIYRSLLADPSIRGRLFECEQAFQTPIFSDDRSNAHTKALLVQVRLLAKNLVPEEPDMKIEHIEIVRSRNSEIRNRQELDAALQNLGEALDNTNELPIPRGHINTVLVEAIKFLHVHLISEVKRKELEFGKDLMRFLGDRHPRQAYNLFWHFAAVEPDDTIAAGLGETFLQTHCKSASSSDYLCLITLSQLLFHYQSLHDTNHLRTTRTRLDEALKHNLKLRHAPTQTGAQDNKDAVSELLSVVPRLKLDDLGDAHKAKDVIRQLSEFQAVSYLLIKVVAMNPQQLERVLPKQFLQINVMALMRSIALGDGKIAQLANSIVRSKFVEMVEEEDTNHLELLQARVELDVMELMAWQLSNNLPQSRWVAQRIKSTIAPFLPQRRVDEDVSIPTCPPPADKDAFVVHSAQPDYFESVRNLITPLEIQWDLKEGKRILLQRVYTALAQDIRDLFRPAQSGVFQQSNNDQEELPKPLSPAQFIIQWDGVYRPAFGGNTDKLRQAATTIKCLLGQPNLEMRLSADLINKRSDERVDLAKAIYRLIEDSGTLAKGQAPIADDDFRLLQMISVLKAHAGISAAAARAVFPTKVREQVQQAEASIGKLERRIDSIPAMLKLVEQGSQDIDMLSTLMRVAIDHPDAYAKYSELRQQSVATLSAATETLGSNEAAVLFSSAGEKLLAVVVRKSGGTFIPLKVSVSSLQATVSQLLASLRLPTDRIHSLPSKFRADAAWKVYQQVFHPLESSLAGVSTVYLVGGEVLAGVPFQTLLTAQPPPQDKVDFATYRQLSWLGDRFAFVSLPSMHSLRRLSERSRQDPAAKLWGVGEPAISATTLQTMKLVGIPETARLLAKAGKPSDPQPLLGERATYANFADQSRSGILSKADIVLINSHTLAAGQGERFGTKDASIVLAPSSPEDRLGADLLPHSKVVEQNLPVRLTMLLACETAGGTSVDHEQPFAGLVNAFFFSGADSVLATVRLVDSEASEDLAINFLHHVRDDRMSSAEALQRAGAEVRCPDDKSSCAAGKKFVWAHPAYWSQFILVGSGR